MADWPRPSAALATRAGRWAFPITGGNVSLYNETEGRAIFPTPVLGVVGLLEDASKTVTRAFKHDAATVVLLGDNLGELGGSEYLATLHSTVAGQPPMLDLSREAALQKLIVSLIRAGLVESAHDCSEGGLAVTLAECTFDSGGIGVAVDLESIGTAPWQVNATLFGESASRIVVSVTGSKLDAVLGGCGRSRRAGQGNRQDRRRLELR